MPEDATSTTGAQQGDTGGTVSDAGASGGGQGTGGTPDPGTGTSTDNDAGTKPQDGASGPGDSGDAGDTGATPPPGADKGRKDDSQADGDAGEDAKGEDDAKKGTDDPLDIVPEAPDKYEIVVPEGVPRDEAMERVFRETAHALGLTQRQAQQLAKMQADYTAKVLEKQADAAKESAQKLQAKWGASYDDNLTKANKALDVFGSPELHKLMDAVIPGTDMRFGDHPAVVEHFYAIGQAISESAIIRGEAGGEAVPRTPAGDPMLRFPSMRKKE